MWIHRYALVLRSGPANARSQRHRVAGCLVRDESGFACLHPWPELGDAPLDDQLAALRTGRATPHISRMRECMARDGAARRAGVSLFAGLVVPQSHATVTGRCDFDALRDEGFTAVKIKAAGSGGGAWPRVEEALGAGLRVRLDFNGTGTDEAWAAAARWSGNIDFIEDPVPYHPEAWKALRSGYGLRLALDRLAPGQAASTGFDVRVFKPAVDEPTAAFAGAVITSYMDHPLGQLYAALVAAESGTSQLCGLLTHRLFEGNEFCSALTTRGPVLTPPCGTGLGFDDLLAALPWQRLERRATVPGFSDHESTVLMNPRAPVPPPPQALIPPRHLVFATSGSTGTPRWVCLSHGAFLANASAVNSWVGAVASDVWLRVLPDFHVGGLGIVARAALSGSRVVSFHERWNVRDFLTILTKERISLTSLVPAQVHDLVTAACRAPKALRAVFAGGGALAPSLLQQAHALGWPLLVSYGMTECSSQVATARYPAGPAGSLPDMELLPCWEGALTAEGRLRLRGSPLLTCRLSCDAGAWRREDCVDPRGWFLTNDRVSMEGRLLRVCGRADRVIKILGELVDLDGIEAALNDLGVPQNAGVILPVLDSRAGFALHFLTELSAAEADTVVLNWNASCAPFARITAIRSGLTLPKSALGKVLRANLSG